MCARPTPRWWVGLCGVCWPESGWDCRYPPARSTMRRAGGTQGGGGGSTQVGGTVAPGRDPAVYIVRSATDGVLRDLILCVDQSGSMAASVAYAGIFGAVLASLPAVSMRMVVFDTSVVDLTEDLDDPVDLLFGTQLGGGTDINQALAYCQKLVRRPEETILVLLSDLFEGGNAEEMLRRAGSLAASGVQMIALLALSDQGTPAYDHRIAAAFATLGICICVHARPFPGSDECRHQAPGLGAAYRSQVATQRSDALSPNWRARIGADTRQ